MKLKKIVKYIDAFIDVTIWFGDNASQEEFEKWEGPVADIPYRLINYRLIEAEENNYSEAIFPTADGHLRITVVRE